MQISGFLFSISVKKCPWNFDRDHIWICRFFCVERTVLTILILLIFENRIQHIYLCLLWLHSSMFCSFQFIDLSPPWLIYSKYFILFVAIGNEIIFFMFFFKYFTASSPSLFTFMHWRRKWQPTPVLLPGESQGRGRLVDSGLPSMGSHRVGHDWSDLAAAAAVYGNVTDVNHIGISALMNIY